MAQSHSSYYCCTIKNCSSKAHHKTFGNLIIHYNDKHKGQVHRSKALQNSIIDNYGWQIASCCGYMAATGKGLLRHKDQSGHSDMKPPEVRDNLPTAPSDSSSIGTQNSPSRSEEPIRQEENDDGSDSNVEQHHDLPILEEEEEEEEEGPRGKALRFMPKAVKTKITNIVKYTIRGLLKASADNDIEAERQLTLTLMRAPELISTKGGKPTKAVRDSITEIEGLLAEAKYAEGTELLLNKVRIEHNAWKEKTNAFRNRRATQDFINHETDIIPNRKLGELRRQEQRAIAKKISEGQLAKGARILKNLETQDAIRMANAGDLPMGDGIQAANPDDLTGLFPAGPAYDKTSPAPAAYQFDAHDNAYLFAAVESSSKGATSAHSAWSSELLGEMLKEQPEELGGLLTTLINLLIAGKLTARDLWTYRRVFMIPKKDYTPTNRSCRAITIQEVLLNLGGRMLQMAHDEAILDIMEEQGQLGQGTEDGTGTVVSILTMVHQAMQYDDNERRPQQLTQTHTSSAAAAATNPTQSNSPMSPRNSDPHHTSSNPSPPDRTHVSQLNPHADSFTPQSEEWCIGVLDITKGFNSVDINIAREKAITHFPGIVKYMDWLYSSPSPIRNSKGELVAMLDNGTPTGDPMSGLLFNLSTLDALAAARSEGALTLAIIDDIYVFGPISTVGRALPIMVQKLGMSGLSLNYAKCKFLCKNEVEGARYLPNDIPRLTEGIDILSIPVGCDDFVREGTEKILRSQQERLVFAKNFDAGAGFVFENQVVGQQPNYWLRSISPSHTLPAAAAFTEALRLSLQTSIGEQQLQPITTKISHLPIRSAGIGLKNIEEDATPAYIASNNLALLTMHYRLPDINQFLKQHRSDPIYRLVSEIEALFDDLPDDAKPGRLNYEAQTEYPVFPRRDSRVVRWRHKKNRTAAQQTIQQYPQESERPQELYRQCHYSRKLHEVRRREVERGLDCGAGEGNFNPISRQKYKQQKSLFISNSNVSSGCFINSATSKPYFRVSGSAWTEGIRQRLLLSNFSPPPGINFRCDCCNSDASADGSQAFHGMMCKKNAGFHTNQHDKVVQLTAQFIKSIVPTAKVDMQNRPGNTCNYAPNKAVDIVVASGSLVYMLDVSIVAPCTKDALLHGSSEVPLTAAKRQEEKKTAKHAGVSQLVGNNVFVPFVLESTGNLGESARRVLDLFTGTRDRLDGTGPIRKISLDMVRARNDFLRHVNAVCIRAHALKIIAYRNRARMMYNQPPPQTTRHVRTPLGGTGRTRVGGRGVAG